MSEEKDAALVDDVSLERMRTVVLTEKPRSKVVEFGGVRFEIRAPSLKRRSLIFQQAKMMDEEKRDIAMMQALCVIWCVYKPGTSDRPFSGHDVNVLMEAPVGSIVDLLGQAAQEFMKKEEAEERVGNSAPTPSGTSSTA